jgi:hypothetical protein
MAGYRRSDSTELFTMKLGRRLPIKCARVPDTGFDALMPRRREHESCFMTEYEAAIYLAERMPKAPSVRTLQRWRSQKKGPKWNNGPNGRPIWYSARDLDIWLEHGSRTIAA